MTDQVTRLVIRADGALLALGQYERGMEEAGKATDYTTGALADFERRMEVARAAMERGNAVSTQTVARKSAEERAWEKWQGTIDRVTRLRIKLEREAMQASVAAANAVNMGHESQEAAIEKLVAIERRHAAQLSAAISAEQGMAAGLDNTAAAADRAAMAVRGLNAANDNRRLGSNAQFSTANIAAQMFDVGVTSPFMPAWQVGLQQGSQLAQAFAGQSLQQSIMGVGGALLSLINPVSLLTIGFTTLAALGIQAFMGISSSGADAERTLKEHKEWLDELLVGYDKAAEAADRALTTAQRLPKGVLESDLRANLLEQDIAADALQKRIDAAREQIASTAELLRRLAEIGEAGGEDSSVVSAGAAQIEFIRDLGLSSETTAAQLDAVMVASRQLYNSIDDPAIRDMAKAVYDLAFELRELQARASAATGALAALNNMDIQVSISTDTDKTVDAIEKIVRLTPELRSTQEQVRDIFEKGLVDAPDDILRYRLQQVFDEAEAAFTEQDRRREAERLAKASDKTYDRWGDTIGNFEQRIASQRLEIDLLGQSTYEITRQKAAFDLRNQAMQAGIPITAEVTGQINRLSAEYARETTALEQATEARRRAEEQMNFYKSTVSGFVLELAGNLRTGEDFWESFANAGVKAFDRIADRALSMAVDGIWDMIFGAFAGALSGPTGGAWGNGLWGSAIFNAKGGVYASPSLSAYSNGIYDRPQVFAFARGAGVFGEAGPEAIMPLARTPGGDLGVRVANQNQGNDNWPSVQIVDQRGRNAPAIEQERIIGPDGEKQLRLIVRDEMQQAHRRGALGF